MPASMPRAAPVREDDSALVRVLEAHIETLKAENEILTRRLAAAETRAAQETAKADGAIAELSALRGSGRGRPPLTMAVRGISAVKGSRSCELAGQSRG